MAEHKPRSPQGVAPPAEPGLDAVRSGGNEDRIEIRSRSWSMELPTTSVPGHPGGIRSLERADQRPPGACVRGPHCPEPVQPVPCRLDMAPRALHMVAMEPPLQASEIRAALRSGVPLFHGLPEEALERAVALARRAKRAKGEVLFEQGAEAEAFHLLLAGRLKVSQTTPAGEQVIVRYLGPYEIAGCVAVCGGVPYPATATAVEDTWLMSWTRPRIAELAERHPAIAMSAMRIMGGRMTELQERLKELQTQRVERRIARALGRLVVQAGRRTADGIEIDFPITRQDLAEMTGTTLHTVSRTLSEWATAGIVSSGRQKVVIRQPHALAAIAEDLPETEH